MSGGINYGAWMSVYDRLFSEALKKALPEQEGLKTYEGSLRRAHAEWKADQAKPKEHL